MTLTEEPPKAKFRIYVNDKPITVADDDQEAAAVLRLTNHDPGLYDLFVVTEHGVEVAVLDGQIVNLREGMRLRARRRVGFTIDGEAYSSYDDDQLAAALIQLAGLSPTEYDLARISGPNAGSVLRDQETVSLKDGDEFVTAKHAGAVA